MTLKNINNDCICGETNARNCPVHQQNEKQREFVFSTVKEPQGFSVIWDMAKCDFYPPVKDFEEIHVIERSYANNLENEIAELKAKLWVANDSQLRTYDGLAQKADRADELEKDREILVEALRKIIADAYTLHAAGNEYFDEFNPIEVANNALEKVGLK